MKKTFQKFEIGTAERVVYHAQYKASRGKGPSMSFLSERNPRKALASAKLFLDRKVVCDNISILLESFGSAILQDPNRPDYDEMTESQIIAAARHIISTSENEEEVKRRMVEELGCHGEPHTNVLTAINRIGAEVKELCLALGGVTLKTGELIQVMFSGPNYEGMIMV